MTKKKDDLQQTDASSKDASSKEANFKKEQRAREGTKAMSEYEDEARAIRERTARLRELRLAKEAAEKGGEVAGEPVKPAPQRRTSRSMH